MSVVETLNKIEGMVAGARTLPFTDRILINDNDLVHYVEELRKDLPRELRRADEIMKNEERILKDAKEEADRIVRKAKEYAQRLTNEHAIVKEAQAKAKTILEQTQQQEKEVIERTRANAEKLQSDADAYAKQVFEQLIRHVTGTFQGVQQAEGGLRQALTVLRDAQSQMGAAQRTQQGAPAAKA